MLNQERNISDNLLRHPSSKLVSCRNGQLSYKRDVLNQVINQSQRNFPYDIEIPISLFSIVGTPSHEKDVLFQSLISHYDNYNGKDGGGMSGANCDDRSSNKFPDPKDDLSESGVYLLHKPFYVDLNSRDKILVWILYLYQGSNGTVDDNQLLERFLLFASSRIVEISLPGEDIRIIRQRKKLTDSLKNICKSFLYVLPLDHIHSTEEARLYTNVEARMKLVAKMFMSCASNGNTIMLDNVPDINVIEIRMSNRIGNRINQSMINCIRDMPSASRFYRKPNQEGISASLCTFPQLMEECEEAVNNLEDMTLAPVISSTGSISQNVQAEGFTSLLINNTIFDCFGVGGGGDSVEDGYHKIKVPQQPNPTSLLEQPTGSLSLTSQPRGVKDSSNANHNLQSESEIAPVPDTTGRFEKVAMIHKESWPGTDSFEIPICDKFKEHDVLLLDTEMKLARELIPEMTSFYNSEMKRFLAESLYSPDVLNSVHTKLVNALTSKFRNTFRCNDDQRQIIENELNSSLNVCLPRHLQRNSENWKMKQAKISKCLQKMMSLYMEKIEIVITQNPQGLDDQQITQQRNKIIQDIVKLAQAEILEKIRGDEPLAGHMASLLTEIEEYWECVEERNSENLQRTSRSRDRDMMSLEENDVMLGTQPEKGNSSNETEVSQETTRPNMSPHFQQEFPPASSTNDTPSDFNMPNAKWALQAVAGRIQNLLDAGYTSNQRDEIIGRLEHVSSLLTNPYNTLAQVQEETTVLKKLSLHLKPQTHSYEEFHPYPCWL